MAASYPALVKVFTAISDGDTVADEMWEEAYDEIVALEQELVTSGLTNTLKVNAGVQFPATQAVSTNANILDDYEEGTWTPVIGGTGGTSGQSYATQNGLYIKVGQLVTCIFNVQLSAKGTITTNVQISGLPFAAHATYGGMAAIAFSSLGTTWVSIVAEVAAGASVALITGAAAAASSNLTPLTTSDIDNSTIFRGSLTYRAAA